MCRSHLLQRLECEWAIAAAAAAAVLVRFTLRGSLAYPAQEMGLLCQSHAQTAILQLEFSGHTELCCHKCTTIILAAAAAAAAAPVALAFSLA